MKTLLKSQQHEMVRREYSHNGERCKTLSGSFGPYGLQFKTDRRRLLRFANKILDELAKHGE